MPCNSLSAIFYGGMPPPHFQEPEEIPLATQLRRWVAWQMTWNAWNDSQSHQKRSIWNSPEFAAARACGSATTWNASYWFEGTRFPRAEKLNEDNTHYHVWPCCSCPCGFGKNLRLQYCSAYILEQTNPVPLDCNAPTHSIWQHLWQLTILSAFRVLYNLTA